MIRHMLIVLATVLVAVPLASARSLPEGMTMHRVQAGEPDSSGWIVADSTMGAFSVRLPMKFNDFTMHRPGSDAPVSSAFIVGGKSAEGVKFTAARIVYRDDDTAQGYFSQIENGQAFPSDKSPTTRSIDVDGRRAVDVTLSDGRALSHMRYILLDDSVMSLIVEVPRAQTDLVSQSEIQEFFESLHVSQL